MEGKQFAEDRRQSGHYAHPGSYAEQTSGQPQPQSLQEKDAQQVARSCAHSLQNGQHIHALFQVRVHRHGHADGAQHHGYQAGQAQDRGRTVHATAQRRIAFAEVHYLRVGQRRFQLTAHCRGIRLGREPRW